MMEYYIVLGYNDALSELTDLRSPFFFDDFNDMCTVVIIKKKLARQGFACDSSHI